MPKSPLDFQKFYVILRGIKRWLYINKKADAKMVMEVVQMCLAVSVFATGALLFGMNRRVRQ